MLKNKEKKRETQCINQIEVGHTAGKERGYNNGTVSNGTGVCAFVKVFHLQLQRFCKSNSPGLASNNYIN